jgi:hypothetical protein
MARIRIPPLPPMFLIQDREDGTWWLMSHRSSDERWRISNDPGEYGSPLHGQPQRYYAFAEPWLGQAYPVRFIVRGGRVGYEVATKAYNDQDQAPITSRRGVQAFALTIQEGGWVQPGDVLGYRVSLEPAS